MEKGALITLEAPWIVTPCSSVVSGALYAVVSSIFIYRGMFQCEAVSLVSKSYR